METTYNKTYGRYLGYPECCIEAFGDVATPIFMKPQVVREQCFSGFIPCEACAKDLEKETISKEHIVELINSRRKCTIPFRTVQTTTENELIFEELSKL